MKRKNYIMCLCLGLGLAGCNEFLDAKPDKALLVPTTLPDFQLLLNDDNTMNVSNGLGILSDDDHYMNDASFTALRTVLEKNSYRWSKDLLEGGSTSNWNTPYSQIFNANVVLGGLAKITPKPAEEATYQKLKGAAYFYRAWALFHTASAFAPQYVPSSAASVPGIPVYTKADVNTRPGRGTLKACYDQIQSDLKNALDELPRQSEYLSRPNKTASFALAARVYMSMADYVNAGKYADSTLKYQNTLMDYNAISTTSSRPFTRTNVEVIYQNKVISYSTFSSTGTLIDSILYKSYAANDLRKAIYFKSAVGGVNFKGSYDGTTNLFAGLTVDEMYLNRAECKARAGDATGALSDLNTLLKKRFKTGTFVAITANDAKGALVKILVERRKELLYRGLRWMDLKRLNLEPDFAKTLTRVLNGVTYTLPPNDPRYVLPIPDEEIALGGLSPNIR